MNNSEELFNNLEEIRKIFKEVSDKNKEISEKKYNALSQDDKLDLFCAIVERIYKAEYVERRSYRGALYDVFEFDLDSYVRGMECGYMDIHNSIIKDDELKKMISKFILENFPERKSEVENLVSVFMRNRYSYLYKE